MELFYALTFGILVAIATTLELWKTKKEVSEDAPKEFWKFRANYTLVYALMMGEFVLRWHVLPAAHSLYPCLGRGHCLRSIFFCRTCHHDDKPGVLNSVMHSQRVP